jgi:alpha-L-rhamnosidase
MKIKHIIAIGFLLILQDDAQAQVYVQQLRVEFLKNPLGIELKAPELSWQLQSSEKNISQAAYEIRISKEAPALLQNKQLVWHTGKVTSSESLHVLYAGEQLKSGQKYYWQVRVWDNKGKVSTWSDAACWQMGLLHSADWKGKWIGLEVGNPEPRDDHRRLPARMLRREVTINKTIVDATLFLSGLGFSEFYINGIKVDNRIMDPTHSNYKNRVLYVVFDVKKYLKPGQNALAAMLGNGRFFAPRIKIPVETPNFGFPKMLMQMQVRYTDGSSALITSDDKWKITDKGPIRANSEFDGEEYDANMEQKGWNQAGFDDATWQPAQIVSAPGGKLIAQIQEPMRVIEKLPPVSIHRTNTGGYLVDFGQNFYGMCQIKVKGPKGTKVIIRSTFDIDSAGDINMAPNRSALSTDIYTLKGQGVEVWAPRFKGQGTRYAEIKGWPGTLKKDDIEFLVVHSDLEKVGNFSCSNELVNKIYASMLRTVRMQERGVPMDPDRDERQAWLSVSEKTSETEGYLYNVAAFYNNFLDETRSSQRPNGLLSEAGSLWSWNTKDPCWPAVITTTPWSCYYMYGDKRVLSDNYPAMKRWVLYLEKNIDPDFIYRKGSYSDWVDAYSMDKKTSDNGGTSRELLSTAYMYYNLKTVEKTATFLGQFDDAANFATTAKKVAGAFLKTFFDSSRNVYLSETQTSYVLPLAFGLVPPQHHQSVVDNLVNDIMVKHDGHLTVGCPGLKWLMQILTAIGHTDVAYTILTQTTRPSWGYMISKGGTSIWERWDRDTRDPGMNGQSQTILAGYLGAWMYQTLGGIAYDTSQPGFKNIIMHPEPVGDLTWVNASFESFYGLTKSNWKLENGLFKWGVTIPANATATVYIPTNDAASVKEGTRSINNIPGMKYIGTQKDAVIYEIGSGSYEFSAAFRM